MDNTQANSSSDFSSSIYRHLYNPLEASVWHELALTPQRKLSSVCFFLSIVSFTLFLLFFIQFFLSE